MTTVMDQAVRQYGVPTMTPAELAAWMANGGRAPQDVGATGKRPDGTANYRPARTNVGSTPTASTKLTDAQLAAPTLAADAKARSDALAAEILARRRA